MQKRKLNYRIHDPNPAAVTADYILGIFIEANVHKVEAAVKAVASAGYGTKYNVSKEGHLA